MTPPQIDDLNDADSDGSLTGVLGGLGSCMGRAAEDAWVPAMRVLLGVDVGSESASVDLAELQAVVASAAMKTTAADGPILDMSTSSSTRARCRNCGPGSYPDRTAHRSHRRPACRRPALPEHAGTRSATPTDPHRFATRLTGLRRSARLAQVDGGQDPQSDHPRSRWPKLEKALGGPPRPSGSPANSRFASTVLATGSGAALKGRRCRPGPADCTLSRPWLDCAGRPARHSLQRHHHQK